MRILLYYFFLNLAEKFKPKDVVDQELYVYQCLHEAQDEIQQLKSEIITLVKGEEPLKIMDIKSKWQFILQRDKIFWYGTKNR